MKEYIIFAFAAIVGVTHIVIQNHKTNVIINEREPLLEQHQDYLLIDNSQYGFYVILMSVLGMMLFNFLSDMTITVAALFFFLISASIGSYLGGLGTKKYYVVHTGVIIKSQLIRFADIVEMKTDGRNRFKFITRQDDKPIKKLPKELLDVVQYANAHKFKFNKEDYLETVD